MAAGRDPLFADVPPHRSARFEASIIAPIQSGDYTLVLDLVSEFVAWFADRSQMPIRFSVSVRPRDVAPLLSGPITSFARLPWRESPPIAPRTVAPALSASP